LGIAGSHGINRFAQWETIVQPWTIIVSLGLSTLVGIFFGMYPAVAAARDVAKLIKDEFGPVRIVNLGGRYGIYAGRHRDTKSAMTMKIRLAEEMGFNGRIVRIRRDGGRTYIYGD